MLASAGDVPTLEAAAAAWWLRRHASSLNVRFVNVVDLMALFPRDVHPHGMDDERFVALFTADKPVIFAFHGYQRAIHEVLHGRPNAERFHVRGFSEQGTTTTPFNMVVLNEMSRYHLAIEAVRRARKMNDSAPALMAECRMQLERATAYAYENFQDPPEISEWTWTQS